MALKYKTIPLAGGINRNASHFLVEDGELNEIQNFIYSKIGVLKKSGDYAIKNSQITAGKNILGGIDFARADGTHEHYVAIDGASNAGIYKDVTGTWTSQSQALTAGNKVDFAYSPALDTLFVANFADVTRSYDGSEWSTGEESSSLSASVSSSASSSASVSSSESASLSVSNSPSSSISSSASSSSSISSSVSSSPSAVEVVGAPKAKYIIHFGDRIYLLHTVYNGVTHVSRAYRSTTTETSPITWASDAWITFNDIITGGGKVGERMFVGGEAGCYVFTLADEKYQISNHGCVSHEGISEYGQWLFWPSTDGMYLFDGGQDTKISLPVQDYWDAIPTANLSEIKAQVRGHHLYIFIGNISLDGRTLTNVVLDYNILQNNWSRLELADNVKNAHMFTTSSSKELFIGNDDGEVFQMFTSGTQNTAAFSSFIETPWIYGSGPKIVDDFRELWAHGELLSGLKVRYKVDDKGWESIGEVDGFSDFIKLKVSGKRIKFLLEEVSKENMYELHTIEVGYKPKFREDEETKQ